MKGQQQKTRGRKRQTAAREITRLTELNSIQHPNSESKMSRKHTKKPNDEEPSTKPKLTTMKVSKKPIIEDEEDEELEEVILPSSNKIKLKAHLGSADEDEYPVWINLTDEEKYRLVTKFMKKNNKPRYPNILRKCHSCRLCPTEFYEEQNMQFGSIYSYMEHIREVHPEHTELIQRFEIDNEMLNSYNNLSDMAKIFIPIKAVMELEALELMQTLDQVNKVIRKHIENLILIKRAHIN